MSIDTYKDDIIKLISKNGPMGVNAIQREIGVPLSTLQKYMHRQTYFKINEDKKWDLPENVIADIKSNTLSLMTNVVENNILLLKSQLEEMLQTVDNAIVPISTLKRGVNNISTPVAVNPDKIHHSWAAVDEDIQMIKNSIKKYMSNVPDEYQELLKKMDFHRFTIAMGTLVLKGDFMVDISELLLGKTTTLSEDTIELLKEYQKQ